MKKAGFSCIPLFILLLLLIKSPVFAQDISTGNQIAETKVTNINNNGSVTNHVETTVNGQTTTVDSNKPGELDVKNVNGTITISKSPEVSITVTQSHTASPTPTATLPESKHKSLISSFFEWLSNFFKRILHNL
jgi:hypothetical protein